MRILQIAFLVVAGGASLVSAGVYTISDDRVRNLDTTPAMGRGYSIATNSFQSTCLIVETTTTPSFNYDYSFIEMLSNSDRERTYDSTVTSSFAYGTISNEDRDSTSSGSSKVKTHNQRVVAIMRIERYYSSVNEATARLSDDALTLLDQEDYIGFFKACGPNYVRSIRRAQETVAIFDFQTTDSSSASEFASKLKRGYKSGNYNYNSDSNNNSKGKQSMASSSLSITIKGYGMGLTKEGSQTMVATSIEEFDDVMKFAFQSMTMPFSSDGGATTGNSGQIYGIELVPWVDNTSFQVNAKLSDSTTYLPMPMNLIPNAEGDNTPKDDCSANRGYVADALGKCCEEAALDGAVWNTVKLDGEGNPELDANGYTQAGTETTKNKDEAWLNVQTGEYPRVYKGVCKPLRALPPAIKKNQMASNGEFVALLDSVLRFKLNLLFTVERCIAGIMAFPPTFDYHHLKPQDTVKQVGVSNEFKVTVKEMKLMLDPGRNFAAVELLGFELDEFISMYYSPCLQALYGTNVGLTPETDPQYFMAEPWWNHDECLHMSCLANNMRWDRKKGGCKYGFMMDLTQTVEEGDTQNCETEAVETTDSDGNVVSAEQQCQKDSADINKLTTANKKCNDESSEALKVITPTYFVDKFCLPVLASTKETDPDTIKQIDERAKVCEPDEENNQYSMKKE